MVQRTKKQKRTRQSDESIDEQLRRIVVEVWEAGEISQPMLARAIGTSQANIGRWIHGKQTMQADTLHRLAWICGVQINVPSNAAERLADVAKTA